MMENNNWLYEAVVQRGTNDLYGDAPSDMGSDNEDSVLANDEYGEDKDEKNLVKEAEPVRQPKDIEILRKLGYSDERIARIDRSESEVIIMNRIPAKKNGKGRKTKYLPNRRHESIKEKAQAFWTELDENLFTKASMTLGKTFLPGEDDDDEEEDIDEDPTDQYNVNVRPATPGHETYPNSASYFKGEGFKKIWDKIKQAEAELGPLGKRRYDLILDNFPISLKDAYTIVDKINRLENKQKDEDELDEKSPKGWEGTVKAMKKHKDDDNPYALSHWMKNKGYKSHKTKSGKDKPNEDKNKSSDVPSRSKPAHGVALAKTGPKAGSAAQRSLDRIVKKHK